MKRKPLFRMTKKRVILLERIITTINLRYEHVIGLSRMFIEEYKDEEKKRFAQQRNLEEEQKLALVLDVLHSVSLHEDDFLLSIHMKENRGWRNEWDVPDDVFQQGFEDAIEVLKWYQERAISQESVERHQEKINFLKEIVDFRMRK